MKFNELIHPGANYEFVGKSRLWFTISLLAIVASIGMLFVNKATRGQHLNWTIDFKGGTEIILTFPDQDAKAGDVRAALKDSGHGAADVSTFTYKDEAGKEQRAYLIRLPEFGAVKKEEGQKISADFVTKFGGPEKVVRASFSGDTFYARTAMPIGEQQFGEFFAGTAYQMKPWTADQQKEFGSATSGTNEYNYEIRVAGLEASVQSALAKKLGTSEAPAKVEIKQVDAVGAKAGAELRLDGIKSMLYAILLIMLYIAFRFDFRYGPGTVAALLHDAIIVVGVFAVFWTEFSLTTVAAVLTVIGYSMNDTVVVFDRIRENEHRLKDKKFDRVINISINETLSRTLLTSLTTFVTTLCMNLLGTGLVKNFAFAMNVGIIVGTYSSIFIAAPILLWLNEKYFAKRASTRRISAPAEST